MKDKNIKITVARMAILKAFEDTNHPLSYEDLKDEVQMDKATFYRNIAKFEEEGIVNAFESNDKKRYFELKRSLHAHFICIDCKQISCIHTPIDNLEGYKINNVIINGTCKNCLNAKNP